MSKVVNNHRRLRMLGMAALFFVPGVMSAYIVYRGFKYLRGRFRRS